MSYKIHEYSYCQNFQSIVKSEKSTFTVLLRPHFFTVKFDVYPFLSFKCVIICIYIDQTYTYFPLFLTLYLENDFKFIEQLPGQSKELSHSLTRLINFLNILPYLLYHILFSPHIFFLLNHLRVGCIHHVHLSLNRYFSVIFIINGDIFLITIVIKFSII